MNRCNKYIYFVEQNSDTHQTNDIYLQNKIDIHVEQIFDWRKICAKQVNIEQTKNNNRKHNRIERWRETEENNKIT